MTVETARQFHKTLTTAIEPPIAAAPALRPDEPYARDEVLHTLFDERAAAHLDAVALQLVGVDEEYDRKTQWTYRELTRRSLGLAHRLCTMGIGRGDRVVICLPRGLDQYMAILGVLRTGAAYVPVDWAYPQDRTDFIIEDSGAKLTLTAAARTATMRGSTLAIDEHLGDLAAEPVSALGGCGRPGDRSRLYHLYLGNDGAAQGRDDLAHQCVSSRALRERGAGAGGQRHLLRRVQPGVRHVRGKRCGPRSSSARASSCPPMR